MFLSPTQVAFVKNNPHLFCQRKRIVGLDLSELVNSLKSTPVFNPKLPDGSGERLHVEAVLKKYSGNIDPISLKFSNLDFNEGWTVKGYNIGKWKYKDRTYYTYGYPIHIPIVLIFDNGSSLYYELIYWTSDVEDKDKIFNKSHPLLLARDLGFSSSKRTPNPITPISQYIMLRQKEYLSTQMAIDDYPYKINETRARARYFVKLDHSSPKVYPLYAYNSSYIILTDNIGQRIKLPNCNSLLRDVTPELLEKIEEEMESLWNQD